jgi:hypothetical protein
MVKLVSTRVLIAFLLVTGACVDAKARFDDFGGRVNDAAPPPDNPMVSEVADITGEFMLSLDALGSGAYIHYIASATLNENDTGYTVDLEFRPVDYQTLELVPDTSPATWSGLVVDPATAAFVIPLDGLIIPNTANPLLNGDATVNGEISATIRSTAFWCGSVTGQVVETGTMLNGSTFGAQRITAGTVGAALPAPAGSCNAEPMEADAGVPDAMPDAAEPDAAMPDAAEPDAAEPDAA